MRDLSHSYTVVFLTVAAIVALTYIPAVFLPKRPVQEAAGRTAAPGADISERLPRVATTRVDRQGWEPPGVGPGTAPVLRQYALPPAVGWRARFRGTGEAGAGFNGAETVGTAEQQHGIGTIWVDGQGWQQPGAGSGGAPLYREYALPPAVGWRTVNGNGTGEAVAGMGRVGAFHDGRDSE
jgi:hypothetical protein